MSSIAMVKVRAIIKVGDSITCATPDLESYPDGIIQSFSVSKARGRASSFNATLKVKYDVMDRNLLGDIVIEAGVEGSLTRIFTGMIRSAKTTPCNDDPSYIILNISGVDVLGKLDGMKFTRRQRTTKACWVTIEGVTRKGLRSGKFGYQKRDTIVTVDTSLKDVQQETKSVTLSENVHTLPPEGANSNDGGGYASIAAVTVTSV